MRSAPPAKLVMGVLFSDRIVWERAAGKLAGAFGPLEKERLEFLFDRTDYYSPEMGEGLTRIFVPFRDPVRQDDLAEIKMKSLQVEDDFAETREGLRQRRVNLDPGLLALDKLILATAKNFSHRICLRGGIFAEVELIFRDGAFHPLPWTYPDYRRRETLAFFHALRLHWRRSLRPEGAGAERQEENEGQG
jgi:hypothetical protein